MGLFPLAARRRLAWCFFPDTFELRRRKEGREGEGRRGRGERRGGREGGEEGREGGEEGREGGGGEGGGEEGRRGDWMR